MSEDLDHFRWLYDITEPEQLPERYDRFLHARTFVDWEKAKAAADLTGEP